MLGADPRFAVARTDCRDHSSNSKGASAFVTVICRIQRSQPVRRALNRPGVRRLWSGNTSRRYPPELKQRAVRMVAEVRGDPLRSGVKGVPVRDPPTWHQGRGGGAHPAFRGASACPDPADVLLGVDSRGVDVGWRGLRRVRRRVAESRRSGLLRRMERRSHRRLQRHEHWNRPRQPHLADAVRDRVHDGFEELSQGLPQASAVLGAGWRYT